MMINFANEYEKKTSMKRIYLFTLLLFGQLLFCQLASQTLSESEVSKKLSLISDSIDSYINKGDNKKVLSICENGISLLSKNNLLSTPAACVLFLQAGESCMNLKDYYGAKFYFYKSFVFDEIGEFGIGTYTTIVKKAEEDANISYFKELLGLAKSDTVYLQKLAMEPKEFGSILNNAAWDNYKKGEYSSALDFFEMEISLLDALGQTGNDDYLSIIPCEVMCIIELGNYNLAKSQADYYLNLVKSYKGNNTVAYAEALQTKARVEDNFGNYNEAVELYNESLSLIENIKGKYNLDYIRCLRALGITYQNRDNNHIKCLEIELEIEKLFTMIADVTDDDKVQNLNQLSHLYGRIGDNIKSLNYAKKAVEVLEAEGQINDANYAYQLSTYCTALINNHSYTKAIEIGNESVRIFSQVDRTVEQNIIYRQIISNLSNAYFESGDVNIAISVMLPLLSEEYPDDTYKLSDIQRMVTYYQRAGLKNQVKDYCDKSLKLAEKIGGKDSELYAGALVYASVIQEKEGDAILMLKEAASIYLAMYGENNFDYISTQEILTSIGTANKIKESREPILKKYENLYGKDSRNYLYGYINYLTTISYQYKDLKDIEKLYETTILMDSVSQNIRITYSENDELYLRARHNLAQMTIDCYELTFDSVHYNRGVDIQKEVMFLASSIYGENNIKYIDEIAHFAHIKSRICNLYYFLSENVYSSESWQFYDSTLFSKKYLEIQELQHRVVDYYKHFGNKNSSKYADACVKLADYYSQEINNFTVYSFLPFYELEDARNKFRPKRDKAEQLYNEALGIYNDIKEYNSASTVLRSLSILYKGFNEHSKSANALVESFKLWKNETLQQLSLMTSDEKSQMVFDGNWQPRIDHYSSMALYNSEQDSCSSIYAKISYDIQLLSKGLLLKSETGLRDLILATGNTSVINKYNRLTEIKKILSNPAAETDTESLHQEYQQLERLLMKESELYGNYLHDFSYTFSDVKSSLNKNEVAIEFAAVRSPNKNENDKFYYFALVLKHDYLSPKIICLDSDFSSDSIYQKVWEPLFEEIKDMKNVYFSPTYDLNKLPLETAKLPDGSYLSDLGINLYRISSTREIIQQRKKITYESAVLYGGLEYNADIKDLIASDAEERSNGLRGMGELKNDVESDLRQRKIKWKYLLGTNKEVSEIEKIALGFGVKTKLYSSSSGTESTFKNLSGRMIDIIHIATHGFYIKPLNKIYKEDQMERSGLALAGANHVQSGTVLPEGVDDGVLTADEISRLDLRGTDLIVLSACETGLGDITGEGVYGLQRGFKKAGVKSIIMSLWKVDDDATELLMTSFYENLLAGNPKHDALLKAQKKVRETLGYEDPFYWAAFVLLDGLD